MIQSAKQKLKIFISYASEDRVKVKILADKLKSEGFDPWIDVDKILPGQDWRNVIKKAVRDSNAIIVCLSSNSVRKEGFVQKEIAFAVDVAEEKPEDVIFMIPVRLDTCNVPDRLSKWQWVDIFQEENYNKLKLSLYQRATHLGIISEKSLYDSFYTAVDNKDYQEAIGYAEKILAVDPSTDIKSDLCKIYKSLYYEKRGAKEYSEAIGYLDKSLEIEPDDYYSWTERRRFYLLYSIGKKGRLESDSQILRLEPEEWEVRLERAGIYRDFGQYDLSIKDLDEYIKSYQKYISKGEIDVNDDEIRFNLWAAYRFRAEMRMLLGDKNGAKQDILKASEFTDDFEQGELETSLEEVDQFDLDSHIDAIVNKSESPEKVASQLVERGNLKRLKASQMNPQNEDEKYLYRRLKRSAMEDYGEALKLKNHLAYEILEDYLKEL
jgi:tetratricopeptide (TPR) repeat protein